jgi:NAD(P)H dehydrogenase (quinone)
MKVEGTEVRCFDIREVDFDYISDSKGVIFGTPTYLADFSWQMKKFLDSGIKTELSGKLGAVFATENFVGGGADFALLTMIGHLLVKGMVVYSGGAGSGKPYTHFGAVCVKDGTEEQQERAVIFGERIGKKVIELFNTKI